MIALLLLRRVVIQSRCAVPESSLGVKVTADLLADSTARVLAKLGLVQQREQSLFGNDPAASELSREDKIPVTEGDVLCDCQVMGFQTQSFDPFCVPGRQMYQSPPPAFGKRRALLVNRIGVVTRGLVKLRVNADCIQPLGPFRTLCGQQVHFRGPDDVVCKIRRLEARPKRRRLPFDLGTRCEHAIAPNVLDRRFDSEAPNNKWVADFTYLWTTEGWLYVAIVLDLIGGCIFCSELGRLKNLLRSCDSANRHIGGIKIPTMRE